MPTTQACSFASGLESTQGIALAGGRAKVRDVLLGFIGLFTADGFLICRVLKFAVGIVSKCALHNDPRDILHSSQKTCWLSDNHLDSGEGRKGQNSLGEHFWTFFVDDNVDTRVSNGDEEIK